MSLKGSVGAKKANGKPSENLLPDVIRVQLLLNFLIAFSPKMKPLEVITSIGIITNSENDPTILAIIWYQRHILNKPDGSVTGRIDVGDLAIRTLEGEAGGIEFPDPLAPIETRIMNKLIQARYSDELAYYESIHDLKGQMVCMLNKLTDNPSVDDSYLTSNSVRNYIEFAPNDKPPGRVEDIAISVKGMIRLEGMKCKTTEAFIKFLIEISESIRDGIRTTSQTDEWDRAAISGKDETIGPGFAVLMVETWLQKHRDDKNSIYNCYKAEWGK